MKTTCGPRAMLSRFNIKRAKHYALNYLIFSLFVLFGQSQARVLLPKACEINAVTERRTVIVLGFYLIRRLATASNLSKYSITK